MKTVFQGTWTVRPIDTDRWAVQSMIPINKDHVRQLLDWIDSNFQHCSGHVNGGTHGDAQGHHAANPHGGPVHYGDVAFTTEDMQSIMYVNNFWSIHTVTRHSPPIYPSVNFTVNAWCYSDALHRIQEGPGLQSAPPPVQRQCGPAQATPLLTLAPGHSLSGPSRPHLPTAAAGHSLGGPAQPHLVAQQHPDSLAHSPSNPVPMSTVARPLVVM